METALLVVVVLALATMYLIWLAGRLDRLHIRVDAGRSALDAALLRRAALAEELAEQLRGGGSPAGPGAAGPDGPGPGAAGPDADALADTLAAAARATREAGPDGREPAENALTRRLRAVVAASPSSPGCVDLLQQLDAATARVALARNIANVAVDHTLTLRRRRVVRWLHLAGRAAAPAYFEIDDSALLPGGAGPHPVPARREH